MLIDELGRATDPEEGGALGVAVLDAIPRARSVHRGLHASDGAQTLRRVDRRTSATAPLKDSTGFNEATLEPTYVLRLGAPGKSAGLDIASRLGLDPALIQDARARMTTTERDIAHFLSEMHQPSGCARRRAPPIGRRANGARRPRAIARTELGKEIRREDSRARTARLRALRAVRTSAPSETIGDLSQKARAKIAKTRREFQEAVRRSATAARPRAAPPRHRPH